MRRCAILATAIAASLAPVAGCKGAPMASAAQCEHLLDHYLDLRLSEDPAARAMTDVERARHRGQIALEALSDPDVKQVKYQCQTEVTAAEYDCAVKATTSHAWNDCIQ
jgi:hypothetical protein